MGFRNLAFVDAYATNRRDGMVISLEADTVGRAVLAFMRKNPKGFTGAPTTLLFHLNGWKPESWADRRDWPADPPRLSTALDRVTEPLAAVGIECCTGVDRRNKIEKGGQNDVVLRWR